MLLATGIVLCALATAPGGDAPPGALGRALEAWRAEHGRSWRAVVDPWSGRAQLVWGGGVAPDAAPRSDADLVALARTALERTRSLHGVDPGTLVLDGVRHVRLAHVGTTDKAAVLWRQVVDGVPVEDGGASVLLGADGTLLAVHSTALPAPIAVATAPSLGPRAAARAARAAFERDTGLPVTRAGEPALVLDRLRGVEARRPVLCWRVDGRCELADTVPEGQTYWIDAHDGAIRRRAANVHTCDVTGTVTTLATPGTTPDTPANPPAETPCRHLLVQSDQGQAVTTASGSFNFAGHTTVTNVRVGYEGFFADVDDANGADHEVLVGTLSGSGNTVLMNPAANRFVTAQANAYRYVTYFRDWVRVVDPVDAHMDFVALAHTNIEAPCNAYYDGSSTNYFAAGGGCTNTAFSTVVAHEQGHWANDLYGIGNGWDGMGEGNADVWAMYQHDTPLVGEGFFGPGTEVRDGDNLRQYCGDGNGGCYGEVHVDGEVWMGAAWKIRTNLQAALGAGLGRDTANALFLGWMNAYNQTAIHSVIESQWLALDDDDANASNGTPSWAEIDAAFRTQGFPGFDLDVADVTNLTELPHTGDEVGPYTVSADVVVLSHPPAADVSVHWSVDGGPYQSTPMPAAGGTLYQGAIPGVAAPATVRYFVTVTDQAGYTVQAPAGGPDEALFFMVGQLTDAFVDTFETDQGWTVVDEDVISGGWERADPEQTVVGSDVAQPEDDHPLIPGNTLCYVTGASAGAFPGEHDVDDGPTRLVSPVIDLAFRDGVVRYGWWFYTDGGSDRLVVELSNDAGASWTTLVEHVGGAGGWQAESFHVGTYLTPTDAMRLRFSVADNPNDSITEAAIDDVQVRRLDAPGGCPPTTSYCVATANSTGQAAGISSTGSTSIGANDLVLHADGGPPGNNGLYIYSPDAVLVPLGDGNLCVGSATLGFVLRLPPVTFDGAGTASFAFDVGAPPDPAGQVSAGETWRFQLWYRDPAAMGAGFNFSDGLEVSFCP